MKPIMRIGLPVVALTLCLGLASFPVLGVTVHTVDDQTYQGRIEAGLPSRLALQIEGSIVRVDRAQITRLTFEDGGVTIATVGDETFRGQLDTELPDALTLATRSAAIEIPYADIAAITFERPPTLLAQFSVPLTLGIGLSKRSIPLAALQDGTRPIPDSTDAWTPTAIWEFPLSILETTLSSGPYEVALEETRTAVRLTVGLNLSDIKVAASRVSLNAWHFAVDYLHYVGHQPLGQPIAIGVFFGEQRNFALVQLNPYVSAGLGITTGAAGPPIARSFATLQTHVGGGLRINVNVSDFSIHVGAQMRLLPISFLSGNGLHGRLNLQAGLVFNF